MFLRLVKAIALKQNPNLQMEYLVKEPFSSSQLLLQNIGLTKFLGTKDAEKVEISQKTLDILKKSSLTINRDNTLKELNQELQDKTFLISNYLTVADLAMYSFLYSSVPLGSGDKIVYCNVMRYFDLIQHQVAKMISQPTNDIEILEFDLEIPFLPSQPVEKKAVVEKTEKKPDGKDTNKKAKSDSSAKEPEKESLNPTKLDIRVGRILAVERHPEADSLFVETIDVGEEKPRTVVSGLVKFMKESDLINKNVCLLCNLKPAKMRGIESAAMVLCANSADGTLVEVLDPPSDSNPGDKLVFDGFNGAPEALLKPKQKIWESLQPNLFTNGTSQATFVCPDTKKEHVLKSSTSGQPVTSKSLKKATIK